MTSVEEPGPVPAACIFGVQRILPLLDAFLREIEGVRMAQDIEHIHRMRVASRRLRAALPLFKSCFPEKKFRRWMRELQRITRALGDARDTDVQIAFLIQLKKEKPEGYAADPGGDAQAAVPAIDIETFLIKRLQKKRRKLQKAVLGSLANLERSDMPGDMRAVCSEVVTRAGHARSEPAYGIPPVAAARISSRLNTLLQYERHVYIPDAIAEHHAMRIAAKKLRYTMEVYASLYRRNLTKFLERVKKIQEILGDLHDCDVWIDTMVALLSDERSSFGKDPASCGREGSSVTGCRHFLSERKRERKRIYRRLVRYWESIRNSRLWDEFRMTLTGGIKVRFAIPEISPGDAIRSSVSMLSAEFPEGIPHSRTVTTIALQVFDDLTPLHRMHTHERFLLECSCSLHDIGWKYGQKGHGKRSMEMIISDDTLPIGITDRGMIGLVCAAHRGNVRMESEGFFSLLSPEMQGNALMLASLLRIADGLDYLHRGSVTFVHCSVSSREVVVETSVMQDASAEISRALQKGDLFRKVFDRELVIR